MLRLSLGLVLFRKTLNLFIETFWYTSQAANLPFTDVAKNTIAASHLVDQKFRIAKYIPAN